MIRSDSIKELAGALSKAQSAYKAVQKSGKNNFFKNAAGQPSSYPTLSDFIEASVEALTSNGLSITQSFGSRDNGRIFLSTTLLHISGEFLQDSFDLLIGKQDMQGFGSAGTYGRRYAYAAIAGLAPEDDDGNESVDKDKKPKGPPKPKDPPRNETPVSMMDVSNLYSKAQTSKGWQKAELDEMLLKHYKLESALKLKRWEFEKIMAYLEQK